MEEFDIECPYCGKGLNIDHEDGYGYEEGVTHTQYCHHCDKEFVYTTSISYYYEVDKADCLNGGEHIWELTPTFPKYYADMQCKCCGERRQLTEEERKKYNVENYI